MITLYRASRHGSSDGSHMEGVVPPGKPYATHVNGRLVLARDLPSKRNSIGVGLLGEAFGGVRKSKTSIKRAVSFENLKGQSTLPPAGIPYNPHQQVPYSMPIPQVQIPAIAPMQPPVLGPPPVVFAYPIYSGPPLNMSFPTTTPFPQFPTMQLYPPQPLPGRYAIPKQARNISQPAAAFEDLKKVDEDFQRRSFSEPLEIRSHEPANEKRGHSGTNTPKTTTTVMINKHVCANCGRIRSRRYHHDNPLKPGENPVPGFCHKCQRDESSLSGKEGKESKDNKESKENKQDKETNETRNRNKRAKKPRKTKHNSPSHSACSSIVDVVVKKTKDKRRASRYGDLIIEEDSPEERQASKVKIPRMKNLPKRVSSSESTTDEKDPSDQESLPRTQSRQQEVLPDHEPDSRSFQKRVPVVHFDEHSPVQRTTRERRASPLGGPTPIRYRTVLATPIYEDQTTSQPQIHRREPFGLRSTDAKTISRDEDYHQGSAASYPRETRIETRREDRSYPEDYREFSSQSTAAPEEVRKVEKRVRLVDHRAPKADEQASSRKWENPNYSGRGDSERAWTKVRHENFEKGIYGKVHEYPSANDSCESHSRSSDRMAHDAYEREGLRRSYRRNGSVDHDLASSSSSLEFLEANRLAHQNLHLEPLRYMTPSPPRYTSRHRVPPKVPTPPRHRKRGTHQPEVEKLSPQPSQRAPRRHWTDGQNDSLEYPVSSPESTSPKPSTQFKSKAEMISSRSMPSSQEAIPSIGSSLLSSDASRKPIHERRMSNGRPAFGREATDNGTELLHTSIFEAKIISPTNSQDSLRKNKSLGLSIIVDTHKVNTETALEPSPRCPPPPSFLHEIPAVDSLAAEHIPDNDSNLTLLTSKNLRRNVSDLQVNGVDSYGAEGKRVLNTIQSHRESGSQLTLSDIGRWSNVNGTWGQKHEFDFGDNQHCWED